MSTDRGTGVDGGAAGAAASAGSDVGTPDGSTSDQVRRSRLGLRPVPIAWLVLVWILLWGTWTWANLLGGLVVAVAVTAALPLPDRPLGARLHLPGLARFLAWFGRELVESSLQVAWQALGPHPVTRNAVIAVPLRTRSDAVLTTVAEALSLIPGSLVLELDRETWTIYLHVLGAGDLAAVEAARRDVRDLEDRVALALGPADERAAARASVSAARARRRGGAPR